VSRTVVITGASSGIGRATAQAFAREGARLVLVGRTRASLDKAAAECEALGAQTLVVPADVSDTAEVESIVSASTARFGRIDVWVGGASVYGFGGVLELPEDEFRRILDINVLGQVRGVRAVLPGMLANRSGIIVLLGSVYSKLSAPYVSAYVASKHAVSGFADSLRQELRGTGVRVVVIFPTTIDTPIHQQAANHTGHMVRPLFPVVSARRVAAAIVRRSHRPRRSATIGLVQGSMIPVRALAHGLYDAIITVLVKRVALRDESQAATAGNLYEPRPELEAVSGGWLRSGLHESEVAGPKRTSSAPT
jgi:short-subunit dehydrogenase